MPVCNIDHSAKALLTQVCSLAPTPSLDIPRMNDGGAFLTCMKLLPSIPAEPEFLVYSPGVPEQRYPVYFCFLWAFHNYLHLAATYYIQIHLSRESRSLPGEVWSFYFLVTWAIYYHVLYGGAGLTVTVFVRPHVPVNNCRMPILSGARQVQPVTCQPGDEQQGSGVLCIDCTWFPNFVIFFSLSRQTFTALTAFGDNPSRISCNKPASPEQQQQQRSCMRARTTAGSSSSLDPVILGIVQALQNISPGR